MYACILQGRIDIGADALVGILKNQVFSLQPVEIQVSVAGTLHIYGLLIERMDLGNGN